MKLLFRITFVVLFFTGCLVVLCEGYLRWHYFALPTSEKHHPHPYLQTILRRDVPFIDGEALDENGFRSTGPSVPSNREAHHILVIGDSCAFSISSRSQETSFPTLLKNTLNRTFDTPFEVTNAGVPGYGSLQIFLWLSRVFDRVSPDEVLIYGGWNDFRITMHDRGLLYIEDNCLGMPRMYRHGSYWELRDENAGLLHRTLRRLYLFNLLSFKIKAHYIKKEITEFWHHHPLAQPPPDPLFIEEIFTNFERNTENMIALSRGRGAQVSLVTLGTPLRRAYTPAQEAIIRKRFKRDFLRLTPAEMAHYVFTFNDILRRLAEKYECRLYDFETWFHEVDDASMFVDIVHPSDKGYAYLVDHMIHQFSEERNPAASAP
jgi:lysophospholipase L1-like esterase